MVKRFIILLKKYLAYQAAFMWSKIQYNCKFLWCQSCIFSIITL